MESVAALSPATSLLARPVVLALAFTVVSGLADAYGFVHASRIWRSDLIDPAELGRSCLGFGVGVLAQVMALRYLNRLGITVAEVQTIIWFTVAIVGVALLNRTFWGWAGSERLVAVGVVFGLAWLMARTGS